MKLRKMKKEQLNTKQRRNWKRFMRNASEQEIYDNYGNKEISVTRKS